MSSKKFMVFDQENVHEYNIVVEETDKGVEYSLFMSEGEQWNDHAKGELVLSMVNDGNGVTFSKKLKKLDYTDLFAVRLLLNLENFMDSNPRNREKSKIVEEKIVVEI